MPCRAAWKSECDEASVATARARRSARSSTSTRSSARRSGTCQWARPALATRSSMLSPAQLFGAALASALSCKQSTWKGRLDLCEHWGKVPAARALAGNRAIKLDFIGFPSFSFRRAHGPSNPARGDSCMCLRAQAGLLSLNPQARPRARSQSGCRSPSWSAAAPGATPLCRLSCKRGRSRAPWEREPWFYRHLCV